MRTGAVDRLQDAAAGVLAGVAGLSAGELVARLVPHGYSLLLAVGNAVVDAAPPAAKNVAIAAFGTSDKTALVTGTVVILLAVSAGLGVLARRSFRRAATGVVALVVLGLAAGLGRPGASLPAELVVAVAAAGAGVLALRELVGGRTTPAAADADGPLETAGHDRRAFLTRAGTLVAASLAALAGGRLLAQRRDVAALRDAVTLPKATPVTTAPPAATAAAAELDVPGITPLITPVADFYRIDTALETPQVDPRSWRLSVTGLVDHPATYTYDELLAMPQTEAEITISCVSNPVNGPLVGGARWQGVLLRDLLARSGVTAAARQVAGVSVDGFTAAFPVSVATDGRAALLVLGMDGQPLPVEHGFPARLVVPGLYGYVSATKWLSEIRLVPDSFEGFWIPRGWSKLGPVKTEARIDVPGGKPLSAGRTTVAGVAWAPHRGISRVEVRIDDGAWTTATLGPQRSPDLWRQWAAPWDATPGDHTVTVRATDGNGVLQTSEVADPEPDGASGYPSVRVSVRG